MSDGSKIEWLNIPNYKPASWNPIRARDPKTNLIGWHCVKCSPGCLHCYAETANGRMLGKTRPGQCGGTGLPYIASSDVELFIDEETLAQPNRWKKPRVIFVESMSDLFGKFVLPGKACRVTNRFAECRQHLFLVLTKRANQMLEHFTNLRPLPNVWLGTSIEDQKRADERLEPMHELAALGWNTWVSYEPILGPVNWGGWEFIKWLVMGGESGKSSASVRECGVRWFRDAILWGRRNAIPCFVKQLGNNPHEFIHDGRIPVDDRIMPLRLKSRKGAVPAEWPEDLRVREVPQVAATAAGGE